MRTIEQLVEDAKKEIRTGSRAAVMLVECRELTKIARPLAAIKKKEKRLDHLIDIHSRGDVDEKLKGINLNLKLDVEALRDKCENLSSRLVSEVNERDLILFDRRRLLQLIAKKMKTKTKLNKAEKQCIYDAADEPTPSQKIYYEIEGIQEE